MTVLIYIHNLKNPWKQDLCVHFYFQSTTTLAASECFRKNILPFTNPSPNFVYKLGYRNYTSMLQLKGSSIKYVRKTFRKTNISNPLIRTCTCEYQGVRNVSFLENFAYVLNGLPRIWIFSKNLNLTAVDLLYT